MTIGWQLAKMGFENTFPRLLELGYHFNVVGECNLLGKKRKIEVYYYMYQQDRLWSTKDL